MFYISFEKYREFLEKYQRQMTWLFLFLHKLNAFYLEQVYFIFYFHLNPMDLSVAISLWMAIRIFLVYRQPTRKFAIFTISLLHLTILYMCQTWAHAECSNVENSTSIQNSVMRIALSAKTMYGATVTQFNVYK